MRIVFKYEKQQPYLNYFPLGQRFVSFARILRLLINYKQGPDIFGMLF